MIESLPTLPMFHNQYGSHLPKQGWTKWGGAVYGIDKTEFDQWYCQACGDEQIKGLPSYMIPMDESQRDFIRVCSSCKFKAVKTRVRISWDLIRIIKVI